MSEFQNVDARVVFGEHYNHVVNPNGEFLAEVKHWKDKEQNTAALIETRQLIVKQDASPQVQQWVDFLKKNNEVVFRYYYP